MSNCNKALAAVADVIIDQAAGATNPKDILLLAKAAAIITEADKMASGNLFQPFSEESDNGRSGKDN